MKCFVSTFSYSGSDLRELCRTGAVYRLRELAEKEEEEEEGEGEAREALEEEEDEEADLLRPITNQDLLNALAKMRESKMHCGTSGIRAGENFSLD